MPRCIAYTRPDGGLSICVPVISRDDPVGMTDEDALQRALKDVPNDAISLVVVDDVPADRTFRNAWRCGSGGIEPDLAASREIAKDHIRRAREPLLAALDIAYQRADETGEAAAKQAVAARKQTLRDATDDSRIAAAADVGALKAAMQAVIEEME